MNNKLLLILILLRVCTCVFTRLNHVDNTVTTMITTDFYNTTELTTEFEYNVSTSPNTTDFSTIKTNETVKFTNKLNFESDVGASCLCDLHVKECDIGCCCDEDCSYEKKKIFERCDEIASVNVDRTFCQYLEKDYVNFTVHEWEIQNNDFLCVAKTNLPPSFTLQREKPFRSYTEKVLRVKTENFWPNNHVKTRTGVNFSEPYIQGISIKYVVDNSTLDKFKLSDTFFGIGCTSQSEINYLHDFESQCVHVLNENNNFLKPDFYESILFIAQPEEFNKTAFKNKFLTCPEPICLRPNLKICTDVNLRDCKDANKTKIAFGCDEEQIHISCRNIVDSLKYTIHHNGIEGIKNITLQIHVSNVSCGYGQQYEINQISSVEYKWADVETNYSNILSGNPGYLIGKPILVGILVNGTISRDAHQYRENFLVLPQEDMGICEVGEHLYQPIEFGYSTVLLCKIKGSLPVRNNSKPVDICKKLQTDIFGYWRIVDTNGTVLNRTYGLFGNANSSIREEWGDILFEKKPKEILDKITGRMWNKNKTLSCLGLVFQLNVDIYHAKVDVKKLVDQEKILGIMNQFHLSSGDESSFNIINRTITYAFDLDTRVAFYDITSHKSRIIVDAPSLNIKLPSDFFYPFVKMGNSGSILTVHNFSLIYFCIYIISLHF